ncbi:hypothetical protein L600_003300000250 [Isoptericola variabilis J7]|uniref:GerMN domain-containing protein n=2 Tax=Isoptericola TaxID=254250 RepID=F6FRA9_ISOV2|nr:hypothetical protein Isova_0159 [Isoptericola variabilis 225]TWH30059.1 hypothetical protein L600_003300000250 [Isoptericola variabilis J7]
MSPIRSLALVPLLALIALTAACGGTTPAESSASTTSAAEASEPPAASVDEGLFNVDITLRRDLVDPEGVQTDEEILAAFDDEPGVTAVVNPDKTLTLSMSKDRQGEMLDEMRTSMKESLADLADDPENSFTAIEADDDFTTFTVKVDGTKYNVLEEFYAFGLYIQGGLFQQLAGVAADDVDVEVAFVDDKSGEELGRSSLAETLASNSGTS